MRCVAYSLLVTPLAVQILSTAQRLFSHSDVALQYSQPPYSRGAFRGRGRSGGGGGGGSGFGRNDRDGGYNDYGGSSSYNYNNSSNNNSNNNYNSNSRGNYRSNNNSGSGGGRGRGRGRYGDSRGGRPMRRREDYLAENVERLYMLKRSLREVKSEKARWEVIHEARRIILRIRIDPTSHDEKSISVLLNCAAAFKSNPCESIEQAVEWMRNNLDGLSPQNVALFVNALGVFRVKEWVKAAEDEVLPVVENIYKEMRPVEVVMILQACRRMRITSHTELQVALVEFLEPSLPEMPVSQLTTMANALCFHPLQTSNPQKWKSLVNLVVIKILAEMEHIHSKDVIQFALDMIYLEAGEEQIMKVIKRLVETANFHNDEQVGEIMMFLSRVEEKIPERSSELVQLENELKEALITRLHRVSEFVDLHSASKIFRYANMCKMELPSDILDTICKEITNIITYRRFRFSTLNQLLLYARTYKFTSAQVFNHICEYLSGTRIPRDKVALDNNDHENDELNRAASHSNQAIREHSYEDDYVGNDDNEAYKNDEDHNVSSEVQNTETHQIQIPYSKLFQVFVSMRLSLEDIYAKMNVTPPPSLTIKLPEYLCEALCDVPTALLLRTVFRISQAPKDCQFRNTQNDEIIINELKERLSKEGKAVLSELHPTFVNIMKKELVADERLDFLINILKEYDIDVETTAENTE